jgi:hypothetical protein
MVQTPPSGNGHDGNGQKEDIGTEVAVNLGVEVQVQRRAAEIPDYEARLAEIKAALGHSAQVRAAFRPQLESIPREFPGRLGVVLFNQTACALVYTHAEPFQGLTGIAMPGVWPEPEPIRVEVIDNSPAVETLRQLRGVLNGYGNCPSQLQHKVTEATRLLNRGS